MPLSCGPAIAARKSWLTSECTATAFGLLYSEGQQLIDHLTCSRSAQSSPENHLILPDPLSSAHSVDIVAVGDLCHDRRGVYYGLLPNHTIWQLKLGPRFDRSYDVSPAWPGPQASECYRFSNQRV